ncbi:hypothetical protein E1B28_009741 [Marasmius oreades]|uniref:Uncharacterized protein n=1 Tax=Marasmius oreades TaxID=181124 RepID=A0A9P7RVP1_9AGAR|nr:uncharacterized protein E1B28_009730 [Marasmius oreades]XP_043007109.1 uncharacterized protein E1B28_009741 [Marasmius oreades]KAG7090628.1 hypothetical protein E1B28_009730 [Marasmius oreades]KAG7090639.1 hypothetical protein E1B28_009741 [Marasmius oreades]
MKFAVGIIFLATQLAGGLCVAVPNSDAAAECGALGVMVADESNHAGTIRKCADHPIEDRRKTWQSLAPFDHVNATSSTSTLTARSDEACFYDAPYGCSGGSCWKSCGTPGDGKWCWTADGDGSGPWLSCSTYSDCNPNAACGKGIGCARCGCGC